MKRIYAIFLAVSMLIPLAACKNDKESVDMSTSEKTVIRTGPPEKSTDDYYDMIEAFEFNYEDVQFGDGCLSSDIPETAVVKKSISYFSRDYQNVKTIKDIIIYCDEYDNELLRLESIRSGNFYAVNNYKYEYDENGNKITEYSIDENGEDVTKYQYYNDGKIVASERKTAEGNFRERDYTEYDEYGNIILSCHASYDIYENDTLNEPWVRELRNIHYDSSGNILSYDFYFCGNEQPTSSFVLTYDDKNRLLTSEEYFTEHNKSYYDYCEKLEYSYEADCDEPTLFVKTEMDTPDHIEGTVTEERKYDEKGRVVYYKSYNSTHDNVVKIIETEYEELTQQSVTEEYTAEVTTEEAAEEVTTESVFPDNFTEIPENAAYKQVSWHNSSKGNQYAVVRFFDSHDNEILTVTGDNGKLSQIEYSYEYNEDGSTAAEHRKGMNGKDIEIVYEYNPDGTLAKETQYIDGEFYGSVAHTYDGHKMAVRSEYTFSDSEYNGASDYFYEYDEQGRVISQKSNSDVVDYHQEEHYTYDYKGNLKTEISDSKKVIYSYDEDNRLILEDLFYLDSWQSSIRYEYEFY